MSSILLNSKYTSVNFPCRQVTNGHIDLRSYLTQTKLRVCQKCLIVVKRCRSLPLHFYSRSDCQQIGKIVHSFDSRVLQCIRICFPHLFLLFSSLETVWFLPFTFAESHLLWIRRKVKTLRHKQKRAHELKIVQSLC